MPSSTSSLISAVESWLDKRAQRRERKPRGVDKRFSDELRTNRNEA